MANRRNADPFNRALEVFLEWGPAQQSDVRERIAKAVPRLNRAELRKFVAEFTSLRSAACRIVEEQVETHRAEEDGRRRVAELDERISAENVSVLYQQARYSAWRDGFR